MARTPLFRTLSRLLLESRAAARAGVPAIEYAERARERRAVSRRRFLWFHDILLKALNFFPVPWRKNRCHFN